VNIIRKIT